MSSTLSSVFSPNDVSNHHQINDDQNLYVLRLQSFAKNNPILISGFNKCYQNVLFSLNDHINELESQILKLPSYRKENLLSHNVSEDDFDATVFPDRSLTPSSTALCQWRHEQFLNGKFLRLLVPLVSEDMFSIILRWLELDLRNEEERGGKNEQRKADLRDKIYLLRSIEQPINLDKLYEFNENSKDILIDQVNWKSIVTQMRRKGGFKYFDEHSLKRMWIHRCQYGLNNIWFDVEDKLLNQLVEQFGYGKWTEIAQHETFQQNKKSAFMCAQRYMTNMNKIHAKRPFTEMEKNNLLTMYKYRCSIVKDYRFSISYAAYFLGDRCIRDINHLWIYLNPDIQKSPFTPEEDAILLEKTRENSSICWSTLAATHLPDRSAVQCRQRYYRLIKSKSKGNSKRKEQNSNSTRLTNYVQWLRNQPIQIQNFLEHYYPKVCLTRLQKSIVEMNSKKIESLMEKLTNSEQKITKCIPFRDMILQINMSTMTADEIFAKSINTM